MRKAFPFFIVIWLFIIIIVNLVITYKMIWKTPAPPPAAPAALPPPVKVRVIDISSQQDPYSGTAVAPQNPEPQN